MCLSLTTVLALRSEVKDLNAPLQLAGFVVLPGSLSPDHVAKIFLSGSFLRNQTKHSYTHAQKNIAILQASQPLPAYRHACTPRRLCVCVYECVCKLWPPGTTSAFQHRQKHSFSLGFNDSPALHFQKKLTISLCIPPLVPDRKPRTEIWTHASPHVAVSSTPRPCFFGDG